MTEMLPTHSTRSEDVHIDAAPSSHSSRQRARSDTKAHHESWAAYFKKHGPTFLSVLSVITNIIILSAVIPSLKSDVANVKGQADAVTTIMAGFSQTIASLKTDIVTAQTQILDFNSRFNATLIVVNNAQASAETAFAQSQTLLHDIAVTQSQADSLALAINGSLVQMIGIRSDYVDTVAPRIATNLMAAANATLARMVDVRTDFVDRVAPQVANAVQRLNATLAHKSAFCGYSAASTGAAGGYDGANRLCGTACGGSVTAHVCSTAEVLSLSSQNASALALPAGPFSYGWVSAGVAINSGPTDCRGWTWDQSSDIGVLWTTPSYGASERPNAGTCEASYPFVCCDYM